MNTLGVIIEPSKVCPLVGYSQSPIVPVIWYGLIVLCIMLVVFFLASRQKSAGILFIVYALLLIILRYNYQDSCQPHILLGTSDESIMSFLVLSIAILSSAAFLAGRMIFIKFLKK